MFYRALLIDKKNVTLQRVLRMTPSNGARRDDFSHLASGHVLRSAPGMPAFPVRMAIEMFRNALKYFPSDKCLSVIDPCCGTGYLLTVLGITFSNRIRFLAGLDVDEAAITLAEKNLNLLLKGGLERRKSELEKLWAEHGRESYLAAVESTLLLKAERGDIVFPEILARLADATSVASVREAVGGRTFDVAVCDVPHGKMVAWEGDGASLPSGEAICKLLTATITVMNPTAVWVIAVKKRQAVVLPPGLRRISRLRVGHREVYFIQRDNGGVSLAEEDQA